MTFDRADSPDPAVVPRRFVARSLIALSALALAACSPSSDPAASASPDRIAIHFYQRGYVAGGSAASTTLTDAAIAAFARRHPEIQVVTIGLPWTQEGDLKMRAALINRRRIDVFRVTNDQLPDYIPASGGRLLAPIDDYLTEADRADISPGAMEAVTFDGRAMAWPLWSTALSLIANAELLAERGIEPPADRPWTWEEFRAALERATFRRESGEEVWGLTAPARPPLYEWYPLLVAHAGPLFRADPPESDPLGLSPGFALAIERVRELRPWMHPAFDINDQHAAWQQFRGGRAAFIVSSPALIRELAAAGFPHRVLPPPTGEYGRPITTGALGCFAVVDHPDDPERTRAAQLFAKYLTSAEVARDVPGWYLAAPVRQSEASFYADPAYAPLKPIARDAIYMNAPGGGGFLEEAVIPAVQSALLGEMTAEEAKAKMRAALARRMVKK